MDTRLDTITGDDTPLSSKDTDQQINHGNRGRRPSSDVVILLGLFVAAILPRIILALQLDMVTDEVVYILGGKIYLPLLAHMSIGTSGWTYNYEHPPFAKVLMGLALAFNALLGRPLGELFAARLPSILMGTLLVMAIYWFGRAPFGRGVALIAALCLACSPWLVYFSALAYLDMTMTALVTLAYLLLWPAIRAPWLYLVAALCMGLGAASKYTATLAIPGMVLFTAYYFLAIRPRLAVEERPKVPWLWWTAAVVIAPLAFLAADPAIWPDPYHLLHHSFLFEWEHSIHGHLTFLAGTYATHVPQWAIVYIILNKMTAFVTIPAAFFAVFALVQLVRFHLRLTTKKNTIGVTSAEAASLSFLLIWLVCVMGAFSLLNIVVGTHYHLPLAPSVALAGVYGLAVILQLLRVSPTSAVEILADRQVDGLSRDVPTGDIRPGDTRQPQGIVATRGDAPDARQQGDTRQPQGIVATRGDAPDARQQGDARQPQGIVATRGRAVLTIGLLALLAVGPHLLGLLTVPDAEGYTSELFPSENNTLQVAYPGYRDALQWLTTNTHGAAKVGLVALPGTLQAGGQGVSWFDYNKNFTPGFQLAEAHPDDKTYQYDYLIWPMHLVQRGYAMPPGWRAHIIHVVMGGRTIYCYILANPLAVGEKAQR